MAGLDDLPKYVMAIILVGLMLGVGLIILTKFSVTSRTAIVAADDLIVISNATCTAPTNTYISTTSVEYVNTSNSAVIPVDSFTWDVSGTYAGTCVEFTDAGALAYANSSYQQTINLTYTYGASNEASTALSNTSTGIGDFADWMALVVIIVIAGVIMYFVTSSFRTKE